MQYESIKQYLEPYSIEKNRKTTITHAFASSIAPFDVFDKERMRSAIRSLGQDPDADLHCAYCGGQAETWDHVHAIVRDRKFSGYGHRIGNLLPCCKTCNSKKGNKDWLPFLKTLPEGDQRNEREVRIKGYLESYCKPDQIPDHLPEYQDLQILLDQVLDLFKRADDLAAKIRRKSVAT